MKSFIALLLLNFLNAQTEANFSMIMAVPLGTQSQQDNQNTMEMA